MFIDVLFSHKETRKECYSLGIVVDILRATSSITVMFSRGANEVIPFRSIQSAKRFYESLVDQENYYLCGEKGGLKPPFFHFGNSPSEFVKAEFSGKTILFATTNGTKAIYKASKLCDDVITGSFLNLTSSVGYIISKKIERILIVCAGNNGQPSVEDTLFAGAIVEKLINYNTTLSDSGIISYSLWKEHGTKFIGSHAKKLEKLGFNQDIELCAQIDRFQNIVFYDKKHNIIYSLEGGKSGVFTRSDKDIR